MASKLINKLVVTSPDNQLLNIIKKNIKKIITIKRPEEFGLINTELEKTIKHALKKIKTKILDLII